MKSLFTLFLAVGTATLLCAQSSFSLADKGGSNYTNSAVTKTGDATITFPNDEPIKWQGFLTNNSGSAVKTLVKRRMINVPQSSENQFCWSIQCYAPMTNQATDTIDIAAGATDSSFYSYFFPGGTNGVFTIQYVFFDALNTNDSIYVNVIFDVSGGSSSIQEVGSSAAQLSQPYPNPARNTTRVDYEVKGDAQLALYDLSGAVVRTWNIESGKGTLTIDVKGLRSGMYFYSIKNQQGVLATRRLLVNP
jgi:hypothetical protein